MSRPCDSVPSRYSRDGGWSGDTAERATADAPGITTVVNRIVVEPADSGDTFEIC